jgi:hypothetical protein
MPSYVSNLCYNDGLVTSRVVCLTAAKYKPHTSCVWLRLVLCLEHLHRRDFV